MFNIIGRIFRKIKVKGVLTIGIFVIIIIDILILDFLLSEEFMEKSNFTATKLFFGAHRFIEAYHTVLQPICKDTGLPPMAVDILMFIANNPENNTAKDICQCRGLKSGIVSVHIDRLVTDGLLCRRSVPSDRRKTRLDCTAAASEIVEKGHKQQMLFAQKLIEGLSEDDIKTFHNCLSVLMNNIEEIRNGGISSETGE